MKVLIAFLIVLITIGDSYTQKPIDLKLQATPSVQEGTACFDVMIRSSAGYDIFLAGQNYRLFFNGQDTRFREDLISHDLDPSTYGKLDIQHTTSDNIGFVSVSLDSRKFTDNILQLDRKGTWAKTLNLCFDYDASKTLDLTWADTRRTSRFATAEIAFSEWEDADNQQILEPNVVSDFSSADFVDTEEKLVLSLYPNPTTDAMKVELNGNTGLRTLIVKDIIGREFVNESFDGKQVNTYDVSRWPEGSYTALVADQTGNILISEQIIKIQP